MTDTALTLPERFDFGRSARWFFLISPWLLMGMAVFFGTMLFHADDGKSGGAFLLVFSGVGVLGATAGAWYAWQVVRNLDESAISVDDQGLWPTIRNRQDALVPWHSIVGLREREILQRIDALDATGKTVARLEYQLKDFDRLRAIVLQRAILRGPATSTDTYVRPWWHHLAAFGFMLGVLVLGGYLGQTRPFVGYVAMTCFAAVIAWEYGTSPFHLRITPEALEIRFPGRRRRVAREQVSAIGIRDIAMSHHKLPQVVLTLAGGENPVRLKSLGVQAVALHQVLQAWHRGQA
ncbi:hypothetical protein ACQ859_18280 [Roseateles chitinivorans]|uniref:hypothetical protein n=1 Tax=Roseateles chitinivorans TaxID=2917965 RepID=UPI003D66FE46